MNQQEIPKTYNAQDWEDKLYQEWEKSGLFNPDVCIEKGITDKTKPAFSIVLPPPNVTGTLHTGHAAVLTIEDTIVRYHRMKGDRTLWLPGTDHAAIATQSKVESILMTEEGKTRHDLGREAFLKRVEQFAQDSHDTIVNQCKKMGSSLDWSREAYTLDEKRSLAVRTAFKRMYDDGLIYRGDRIVNWDPHLQTTVSDDEIEWKEEKVPLYYLQYGPFVISTARPETKFGDKYVVMHPDDERYSEYADGQKIELEWINGPVTATVIKDTVIDRAFGTGVMTITPWHDHTDFDIATRHNLEREQIIDENGKLLLIAGEFAGMPIAEARTKMVAKLQAKGLIVKIEENYVHNIAINSRGGGIIEPQIKRQWFVAVNKEFERDGRSITLKTLMQEAVTSNSVTILPKRFEKTYFHWIDNLRDWCISRQIWFGHRIPVWYRKQRTGNNEQGTAEEVYCGIEAPKGEGWEQDPDTLDTWFSSGLWTFSTLGWPWQKTWDLKIYDGNEIFESIRTGEKRFETRAGKPEGAEKDWREFKVGDIVNFSLVEETTERILSDEKITKEIVAIHHFDSIDQLLLQIDIKEVHPYKPEEYRSWWESRPFFKDRIEKYGMWAFELKDPDLLVYHPTSLLETGYDIIFFWVARMILMTEYLLDDHPFDTVYLHGLVRDSEGRKMSKSFGNVIDPLTVSEQHGADALRMALISGSTPGNDMKLSDEKIITMRNFTNKLWNLARYVGSQGTTNNEQQTIEAKTDADRYLMEKLHIIVRDVTRHLDRYELSLAAEELREFTWGDFADWYVEVHKVKKNDALLRHAFDTILKLWHPFMPFVTEAIHQTFRFDESELLMVSRWPVFPETRKEIAHENRFELIKGLISNIRNVRAAYHIEPAQKMVVSAFGGSEKTIRENEEIFKRLAHISEVKTLKSKIVPKNSVLVQCGLLQAFLHLEGIVDITKEHKRLEAKKADKMRYIASLETKLGNQNFIERAKPDVVETERVKLEEAEKQLADLEHHLDSLR